MSRLLEDPVEDMYDLGEIEVVDERTGAVIGMTERVGPAGKPLPNVAELVEEASQEDLDRLFGVKRPAAWGSF